MPPIPGFGIGKNGWDPGIRDPKIAIPRQEEEEVMFICSLTTFVIVTVRCCRPTG